MLNKEQVIEELLVEKDTLEKQLGDVKFALRAFGKMDNPATATVVRERRRVNITSELREKYNDEIVAVLEAYGPSSVKQIAEKGNFDKLSSTSVYRLGLAHPRVEKTVQGRTIVFSLRDQ